MRQDDDSDGNFTGFPSPAEEHKRPPLNLHTLLAPRSFSTVFVRFSGDAMTGENIFDEDLLVVEMVSDYKPGDIVLVFIAGKRLVRKLERDEQNSHRWRFCPANHLYKTIEATEGAEIRGKVTHSITHHLRFKYLLPNAE